MVPISIETLVKQYMKNNPGENKKALAQSLQTNLKRKKKGACCIQCGQAIWVIGSSICGWDGCFSCITGEADSSGDYEIKN